MADQFRTPFEDFAGDLLLAAAEYRVPIHADSLAATLTSAPLELVTVARLVELRDVRIAGRAAQTAATQETSQLAPSTDEGGDQGGS